MSQNIQNTFEQQGSRLQQLSKSRKSNLAVAVFAILAFHAAVFGGLLIQGCKPETKDNNNNKTETNQIGALVIPDENPIFTDDTTINVSNVIADLPPVQPQVETNVATSAIQPIPPVPVHPPVTTMTNAAATPTEPKGAPTATEYLVVKGDNFYTIAKKFPGVSVSDIKAANPDVDPTKMKVGQKLVIPAPKETPAKAGETAKVAEDSGNTYTVVAGDNLTVIAKKFKITVAELKKANNMTSDRINVGQKLKIPTASTAASAATATSASAPAASSSAAAAPVAAPATSGAPVVQTPPSAAAITNTVSKMPL